MHDNENGCHCNISFSTNTDYVSLCGIFIYQSSERYVSFIVRCDNTESRYCALFAAVLLSAHLFDILANARLSRTEFFSCCQIDFCGIIFAIDMLFWDQLFSNKFSIKCWTCTSELNSTRTEQNRTEQNKTLFVFASLRNEESVSLFQNYWIAEITDHFVSKMHCMLNFVAEVTESVELKSKCLFL